MRFLLILEGFAPTAATYSFRRAAAQHSAKKFMANMRRSAASRPLRSIYRGRSAKPPGIYRILRGSGK